MPRIFCWLSCRLQALEKIEEEDQLGGDGDKRRDGDEFVDRLELRKKLHAGVIPSSGGWPGEAEEMHRHEDAVHADEREPEVNLAERSFIMRPNIFGNQK